MPTWLVGASLTPDQRFGLIDIKTAQGAAIYFTVRLLELMRGSTPMPIRDILFPMISYPTPTAIGTVEKAVGLAGSLGAHISGLTFELDIRSPVGLYADPVNIGGILAAERTKSAANARDLVAAFDDVAARRNVMHEHAVEHCPPIEIGQRLVAHARLRDLSVFPVNSSGPGPAISGRGAHFRIRTVGAVVA